jgi:hypothetical protein
MFEAPGWVMQTLVALLVIGFIPALVISWALRALMQQGDRYASHPSAFVPTLP